MDVGTLLSQIREMVQPMVDRVAKDPAGELFPWERELIYTEIQRASPSNAHRIRALLAIMAARKVESVWLEVEPENPWPETLIDTAENVLENRILPEAGKAEAESIADVLVQMLWDQDEQSGDAKVISIRAQCSVLAAAECLFEASGKHRFDFYHHKPSETNNAIDPTSTDTALWAADAYAGPFGDETSSNELRREFWVWWLTEALPEACRLGYPRAQSGS